MFTVQSITKFRKYSLLFCLTGSLDFLISRLLFGNRDVKQIVSRWFLLLFWRVHRRTLLCRLRLRAVLSVRNERVGSIAESTISGILWTSIVEWVRTAWLCVGQLVKQTFLLCGVGLSRLLLGFLFRWLLRLVGLELGSFIYIVPATSLHLFYLDVKARLRVSVELFSLLGLVFCADCF